MTRSLHSQLLDLYHPDQLQDMERVRSAMTDDPTIFDNRHKDQNDASQHGSGEVEGSNGR